MDWTFIAAVFGLGLLWGSFLNVVIYRLPKIDVAGLRRRTPHRLRYLAYPLSFCPHCRTSIPPWYNIPLVSYLLLAGRSKCCRRQIGWRYPLVEVSGALIFLAALFFFGSTVNAVFVILFLSLLLVNAIIDWQRFYLLDVLNYPLLWLGLLANIDARFALLPAAVLGAACGYVVLALLAWFFSRIIGQRALGMGDAKLFAALGAWLGWQFMPMLLFLAAVLGVVLAVVRRLWRPRGRYVPFGPALAIAGGLMLFLGDDIMLIYWRFVLS